MVRMQPRSIEVLTCSKTNRSRYSPRESGERSIRTTITIGYDQPLQATVIVDGEHEFIKGYDLSPKGIIDFLELPIYSNTQLLIRLGCYLK